MKKLLVLLVMLSVVFTSSCGNALEKAMNWMEENIRTECTVSFSFTDESDRTIIEQRLGLLGYKIESLDESGTYKLNGPYAPSEGFFETLCMDSEVKIVDSDGNEFVLAEDIQYIKGTEISINIGVSRDFAEIFNEQVYEEYYYFSTENEKFVLDGYGVRDDDDSYYITVFPTDYDDDVEVIEDAERAMILWALCYGSEPLNGEVLVTSYEIIE